MHFIWIGPHANLIIWHQDLTHILSPLIQLIFSPLTVLFMLLEGPSDLPTCQQISKCEFIKRQQKLLHCSHILSFQTTLTVTFFLIRPGWIITPVLWVCSSMENLFVQQTGKLAISQGLKVRGYRGLLVPTVSPAHILQRQELYPEQVTNPLQGTHAIDSLGQYRVPSWH